MVNPINTKFLTNEKEVMAILFISRLFSTLTYQIKGENTSTFWDSLTQISITMGIFLLFSILLFQINKKTNAHLLSLTTQKSGLLSKCNLVVIFLVLLFRLITTSHGFLTFTTNTIYHKKDFIPLALLCFVLIGYFLTSGFPSLAKSSLVVSVLFYSFLIFLVVVLFSKFQWNYFAVESQTSLGTFFTTGIKSLFSSDEFILLLFFLPKISTSQQIYYTFYVKAFLITGLLSLLLELTLKNLSFTQSYPFYALSISSNLSIFQRLDGLFIILWILISVLKIAAIAFCILDVCKEIFSKQWPYYPILLPFLFGISLVIFHLLPLPFSVTEGLSMLGFLYIFLQFFMLLFFKTKRGIPHENP